jgi:hypothetical protein
MNKYAAEGLLLDALGGKKIVVVSRRFTEAHEAFGVFEDVTARMSIVGMKVYRAHGQQRFVFEGRGQILFCTPHANCLRGTSADVIFIDNDADRVLDTGTTEGYERTRNFMDDLHAVVAVCNGVVMRS